MKDERHNLTFNVSRSIRYHRRRRSFYERIGAWNNGLNVIFGSAVILSLLKNAGGDLFTIVPAALVTCCSTLDLIVGSARMARTHHDLARRFIEIEKKMALCREDQTTDQDIASWKSMCLDIEAEEPPPKIVLNAICYNETMRAFGHTEGFLKIGFFQRLFSHFFDFREHVISHEVLPSQAEAVDTPEAPDPAAPGSQPG